MPNRSFGFPRASRATTIAIAALALAAPLASHAGYTVSGNTISWTSDGWYQVQRPATSQWDLCNSDKNPGRSCVVPNGTYTVINHSTGSRADNIPVPQALPSGTGAGSSTSALSSQPGTGNTCNTSWDTWEFLTGQSTRLVSGFQGWCNPGSGISTRAYAPSNWGGSATVNTGTPGANFWVDWKNTGPTGSHSEFDISMSRDVYQGNAQGYGQVPLSTLFSQNRDLKLTARANWMTSKYTNSATPQGKTHVQTIIWLARDKGDDSNQGKNSSGQCVDPQSIDITVVDYMSDRQRQGYFNGTNMPSNAQLVRSVTTSNGTYKVYVRTPGDICEVASYLAIRTTDKFSTTSTLSTIDARPFIDLVLEQGYATSSWYISTMGWEITGANKDAFDTSLGASAGKMVFSCYSIPSLNGTGGTAAGYGKCT